MPLSKDELDNLLQLLGNTRAEEIDCEQCLDLVAEFAERVLAGKSPAERLIAVEQHLSVCAECREEYEALRLALRRLESGRQP
ncbi:MAG: hypothetical protein R2762_29870 [Bryobacteraceae bacterium]